MRKPRRYCMGVLAALFVLTLVLAGPAIAEKPIVIGLHVDYDRLVTLGPPVGQGMQDFIKVFNSKGGTVEGHKVEFSMCNHGYDVNRSLECYQRQKMEGMVTFNTFGTPHTYALTPKLTADQIPAITPGFGRADAADGKRFPYLFPAGASYWSQTTAAIKYIEEKEGKSIKGLKIAYLYYDNPAGKEPIRILELLQEKLGFKLRMFAVPSPGVEMGAQVTDITRRYKADWVVAHLFGRAPSVSFKELVRKGFSLDHYIGLIWGVCETDVAAAGKDISKGMVGLQFTGLGHDFPIHREIKALYKKEGKPLSKHWDTTGYYNRGIYYAALQVEAVRLAIKLYGLPVTGAKVAKAYEHIKGFTLGGFLPPLEITPEDHEGGGWVRAYQWDGTKFIVAKDWYKAHRDIIKARIAEVAAAGKK
ncbi:MAG: ABC transporter substrate-binding protein [Deltaproteobacteria bacterium]|nr:ABC transporter substrate-binding protein [Deltaproteobacteria bacterium]